MRRIFFILLIIFSPISLEAQPKIKILTTTSFLQCAVKVLLPQEDIGLVIPANMCPGIFDLRPKDLISIRESQVIFAHGWEPFIKRIKAISGRVEIVEIDGSLLEPSVFREATEKIKNILIKEFPSLRKPLENNFEIFEKRLRKAEEEMQDLRRRIISQHIKVISHIYQKDFLESLGFEVVGVFARKQDTGPKKLEKLLKQASTSGVSLIVDNLQSQDGLGRFLSETYGVDYLVLTNFPQDDYFLSLRDSLKKIEGVLGGRGNLKYKHSFLNIRQESGS